MSKEIDNVIEMVKRRIYHSGKQYLHEKEHLDDYIPNYDPDDRYIDNVSDLCGKLIKLKTARELWEKDSGAYLLECGVKIMGEEESKRLSRAYCQTKSK